MKIGLVELVPERTIVNVNESSIRRAFTATFVEESRLHKHICVRSHHNGGIYTVPISQVDVSLRANKRAKARIGGT